MSIEQAPPDNRRLLTDLPDDVLAENGIWLLGRHERLVKDAFLLYGAVHGIAEPIPGIRVSHEIGLALFVEAQTRNMELDPVLLYLGKLVSQKTLARVHVVTSDRAVPAYDEFHHDLDRSIVISESHGTVYAIDPQKPSTYLVPLTKERYNAQFELAELAEGCPEHWYSAPDNMLVMHDGGALHRRPAAAIDARRRLLRAYFHKVNDATGIVEDFRARSDV